MKIKFKIESKWLVNYKVKLFSLLCAFFVWFYVVIDNSYEHTFKVPLRLTDKPEGWILAGPVPSSVMVRFRGSGKAFLGSDFRKKHIDIDLQKIQRRAQIPLTVDMVKGVPQSNNFSVIGIENPDSVTVVLDRYAIKKVPVISNVTLKPRSGYTQVGSLLLSPDSLTISGPKTVVDQILEVPTKSKDYQHIVEVIKGDIFLETDPSELISYSVDKVQFEVDVQRIGERVIEGIPVHVTHVPAGVKAIAVPSHFSIKLQGGVNVLKQLQIEEIEAAIDYRARRRYRGKRIPATIKVPKDVSFSDVKPKDFELLVER